MIQRRLRLSHARFVLQLNRNGAVCGYRVMVAGGCFDSYMWNPCSFTITETHVARSECANDNGADDIRRMFRCLMGQHSTNDLFRHQRIYSDVWITNRRDESLLCRIKWTGMWFVRGLVFQFVHSFVQWVFE